MKRRSFGVLAIVAMVIAISPSVQTAQELPPVTGLGKGPQGVHFAILKGIGLVVEGAVIEVTTPGAVTKLKVLSISDAGVDVKVQEIVKTAEPAIEQPAPPPPLPPDPPTPPMPPAPLKRTPKPVDEFRDPFWPVDYEPATV